MQLRMRHISSASFLFGLLCFFLPFITLSCPGANITFSGAQLATGTTVEVPQMFGGATPKKFDSEPLALFALLCALAGLAVGLSSAKGARTISVGLGILGAILLLALKAKISSDVAREGEGMLVVSYGLGYWLALISALFAAGFNFVLSRVRLTTVQQSPEAVSGDSVPDTINPSR